MNRKFEKKRVRSTVKAAVTLYMQNEISKDTLANLAQNAMAWEIITGFREKVKRKSIHRNSFAHRIDNASTK
jgi:hypothetical protein